MMPVKGALVVLCLLLFVSCSPTPNLISIIEQRQDEASKQFKAQIRSPSEVFSVLLIIGGDIVQKAIAQMSGRKVTLVAFSFGWVAYAFGALMSAFGDGTLMPDPDSPASVIVVSSRNKKINGSWTVGRLIRDLERIVEENMESWEKNSGLIVTIFDAVEGGKNPRPDVSFYSFFPCVVIQLVLAAVPVITHRDWSIILMTAVGTMLAVCTGSLPEWREEKYSCREHSPESYILTRGNGHKHVFVVRGDERRLGLVLDDLAGAVPKASHKTRWTSGLFALLWIIFLIVAGGLHDNTWYLLGVGAVGMIQNVAVAGKRRAPEAHGIPLSELRKPIFGKGQENGNRPKIMKVLYEVEDAHPGIGLAVRPEFFQDFSLREDEIEAWKAYEERLKELKRKEKIERDARDARVKTKEEAEQVLEATA